MTKELSIEGVRPPPPASLGPTTTTVIGPGSQAPPQAIIRTAGTGPTHTTVRLLQPQRVVTVTVSSLDLNMYNTLLVLIRYLRNR